LQVTGAVIAVLNEQSTKTSEGTYIFALVLCFVTAPLLTFGYVALFLRWMQGGSLGVNWLRQAGRMSLTVYLSQSIVVSLIFAPWGLGLFQEVPLWAVLLIAVGVWAVLVQLSHYWFKRFEQGPLERVMHLLTKRR